MITREQLNSHVAWLRDGSGQQIEANGANLSFANLYGANLTDANLSGANLSFANLYGATLTNAQLKNAIGNMNEIKSAQFNRWKVTWSADVLAIGCQQHPIEKWRVADPNWIAAMHPFAQDWWERYGTLVTQLIDASPATGVVQEVK